MSSPPAATTAIIILKITGALLPRGRELVAEYFESLGSKKEVLGSNPDAASVGQ